MDERQWLLATSYNTGAECLQCGRVPINAIQCAALTQIYHSASMLDEAKRWFEASTMICRFVPEGQERAEKVCPCFLPDHREYLQTRKQISETYMHLLSRYGPN